MPNWFKQNYFTIWLSLVMVSGTDLMATCGLFGLVPWVDWALHSHAWYQRAVHVTFEKKREKRKKEKGVGVGGFALHWNCVKCKENLPCTRPWNFTMSPKDHCDTNRNLQSEMPYTPASQIFVHLFGYITIVYKHTHTHTHTRTRAQRLLR